MGPLSVAQVEQVTKDASNEALRDLDARLQLLGKRLRDFGGMPLPPARVEHRDVLMAEQLAYPRGEMLQLINTGVPQLNAQ